MKLWEKDIKTEEKILAFTTGRDPEYDLQLAPFDVMGSMAHVIMLASVGLLEKSESHILLESLHQLFLRARANKLDIEPGVEDIHSQVEMNLTGELGELGKKIHTGRSRNDQVMLDLKLFLREELQQIATLTSNLANTLLKKAELHREVLLPGYTHMQVAMPSSFGLWFGGYAEALADDLRFLRTVHDLVNQNPLGSAAGFGSSFPVDREMTTRLLGFNQMHVSSVNAQMNRGKTEWYVATGMESISGTLARLAMDAVLFLGQNFSFIRLPEELTTGSSIMPHKKNPDVIEILRARFNRLSRISGEVSAVTTNLISGYHRDFQILKEILHPAIVDLKNCLYMTEFVMDRIEVREDILENEIYEYIFSVEEVNKKVKQGIPFRDAYKEVAREIDKGRYRPGRDHSYTHLGSIGNPGITEIRNKIKSVMKGFVFIPVEETEEGLKNYYRKT